MGSPLRELSLHSECPLLTLSAIGCAELEERILAIEQNVAALEADVQTLQLNLQDMQPLAIRIHKCLALKRWFKIFR